MRLSWVLVHFRLLVFAANLFSVMGMFNKRAHPTHEENDSDAKRLRTALADAFLTNDLDGQRMQTIFNLQHRVGTTGFRKLAKAGKFGAIKGNIARDLRTTLLKGSKWPSLYFAPVRCWDAKKQQTVVHRIPIILPHEVVAALWQRSSNKDVLYSESSMSASAKKHLAYCKQQLQKDEVIGLGLWGDGCPVKFDRSQSLEVFAFNLPGAAEGELKNMRWPVTGVHKHFCLTHDTLDDILEIVSWSLRCLAEGHMPNCRHDGGAWTKSDAQRKKKANKPIPTAALVELRGDWAFYKAVLRLPQFNELDGMCWRCSCTPSTWRDCSAGAPWRDSTLNHWQFLQRLNRQGRTCCPIFSAPYFLISIVAIDWLHTVDKGTAADYLGNLMWMIVERLPQSARKARVGALFQDILQYYRTYPCDSQLQDLTPGVIRVKSKRPCFYSKAAEARCLIPWISQAANYLDATDPFEASVLQYGKHLE